MAGTNTNNPGVNDVLFDRESDEVRSQSVRREWSALQHMLHLPEIEALPHVGTPEVQRRIVNFVHGVRGALADRTQIDQIIAASYNTEVGNAGANIAPDRFINIAQAWLNVLHRQLREEDVRGLVDSLPASIRPSNGTRIWRTPAVVVRGNPMGEMRIDLSQEPWRTGNIQQIRTAITGVRPDNVGINFHNSMPAAPDDTLQEADVNAILATTCNVIDPRTRLQSLRFNFQGHEVVVDLPGLMRQHPELSALSAADLATAFNADHGLFANFCTYNDPVSGARFAVTAPIDFTDLAFGIFASLNIDSRNHLLDTSSTLQAAIARREPLNRLIGTSVDSRELMIALAMIQNNPLALGAIPQDQLGRINADIQTNERLLRTARTFDAIQALRPSDIPTVEDAENGRAVMDMVVILAGGAGASTVNGHPHRIVPYGMTLPSGRTLNITQVEAIARDAGIPNTMITRRYDYSGRNPVDNLPEFQAAVATANTARTRFLTAERHFAEINDQLTQLIALLGEHGVRAPADVGNLVDFPGIQNLIVDPAGTGFAPRMDHVLPNTSFSNLASEVRRALRGRAANPVDIREASFYEGRRTELENQQRTARESGNDLNGSEACWAVIRRGLEGQGLRGPELENTIMQMRNRVQSSPESFRDRGALIDAAFPWDGENPADPHNLEHWNHGRNRTSLRGREFLAQNRIATQATLVSGGVTAAAAGLAGFAGVTAAFPIIAAGLPLAGIAYLGSRYLWGQPVNAIGEYIHHLLPHHHDVAGGEPAPFGIGSHDNPMNPQFRIPTLTRAYFGIKRLMDLPENDPRHVPETTEIVTFMRSLHGALLERSQLNQNNAAGISQGEMNELRADGMKVDASRLATMTPTERMQAVQNYLLNGAQDFYASNGGRYTKVIDGHANRIYRHLDEGIQRYNRNRASFTNNSKAAGVTALKGVKNVYWDAPKYAVNNAIVKPVSWLGRTLWSGARTFVGLGKPPSTGGGHH